jgi:hypothetical protein
MEDLLRINDRFANPVVVCFGLLMSELALFTTIVCPMPFSLRKR